MSVKAASGIASENLPLTADWTGKVRPGGLLAQEYSFKIMYDARDNFSFSLTAGYLRDFHTRDFRIVFPINTYAFQVVQGGITYGRPTVRLGKEWVKLEIGAFLYAYDSDNSDYIFRDDIFGQDEDPCPVLGIEFGERDYFVFGEYMNSFPFMFAGAYEMGFIKRINETYEHIISGSIAGYQDFALGYRGEFRIYGNIAIIPGFSWGLRDQDSAYTLTLGVKTVFNDRLKKGFQLD